MPLMAISLLASCNNSGGDTPPDPDPVTHTITIKGDHLTEMSLTFEDNKFDTIYQTVSVKSGYKLTGGYSLDPVDSATIEFTDTKTISITPKINSDFTITLSTIEDMKYYYNITASGEHISYYADEDLTIPLNHMMAFMYRDLVFYMVADYDENSEGYIPPTSLDIKAGAVLVENYEIEPVTGTYQNVMKKVTIKKEAITGDITIKGDAIDVNYYKIDFPYFFGLKPIAEEKTYFGYDDEATIIFEAASSLKYKDDLLTAENICVNLTGGGETSAWQNPSDSGPVKFEHKDGKYILTIAENTVESSVNVVQIIARARDYHQILNLFTWDEINAISQNEHLKNKIFSIGDTKTFSLNNSINHTVRIIGFNYDYTNPEHPDDTKVGITFDFANTISGFTTHWNDKQGRSSNNYDFILNSTLNDCLKSKGAVYNLIPDELMKVVKTVNKKVDIHPSDEWTEGYYYTQLFPLSYDEIDGNDNGTYEYYKVDSKNRRKKDKGYWLRSPRADDSYGAWCVGGDGNLYSYLIYSNADAVAPAFCI